MLQSLEAAIAGVAATKRMATRGASNPTLKPVAASLRPANLNLSASES
jgi:hypothetical protein